MAKDELIAQALKAGRAPIGMKAKAPGKAKAKSGASAVLANAVRATPKRVNKPDEGGNWLETPIIKSILDALSTGVYAVGNWTDVATAGPDKRREIIREGLDAFSRGDNWGGALDIIGASNPASAPVVGLLKGLSGGIGGNKSDTNTFANTVVNLQRNAGIDTESPESKKVQGILGFAGDVAFDPLNVVGFGVPVKAIRGAQIGAGQFKEAKAFSKATGKPMPEYLAPTKKAQMKQGAKEEVYKYKKAKYDAQQAGIGARALRKKGVNDVKKADFLIENVHVLRKGVVQSLLKTMDNPAVFTERIAEKGVADDILDALNKADGVTDDIMDASDVAPNVQPHLGDMKKLSKEQLLADEVGKLRTTNIKPLYDAETNANVIALRQAKKRPKDADYLALGIQERHLRLMRAGTLPKNITDEASTGAIRDIARDIKRGIIPFDDIAEIAKLAKLPVEDRAGIAKFLLDSASTDSFKAAAKEVGQYGTLRTGTKPLPNLNTSMLGHGKLAVPGKGFTPTDIKAARFVTNPEDSRKFLEEVYKFHATELARHKDGAKLRVIADNIFHKVVGDQSTPAGPLISKRGASVNEEMTAAKWETRWNTHSNIFRMSEVSKAVRALGYKKTSEYDDAWLKILSDIDNRLRLAGIDPHLSNMKMRGDKLVVRLAPSDVFRAMTQTDRIKYIHGNLRHSHSSLREYYPSTILDMAEILIRSATKLNLDGSIDVDNLLTTALATLNGRYSKVQPAGLREIGRNLDVHSFNKANFEVLQELDRKIGTDYAVQFKATKSQLDKIRLLEVVKKSDPKDFRAISLKRLNTIPQEIFTKFTKGMERTGSESNILTHLINTNMRNASVFGGSVAREIGEASAEYTAKVLDALENGTTGGFLSELVIRPPYSSSDEVARALISENQKLVQRSVATENEIKGAYALNKNVKGEGNPAANNAEAFQKSDLLEEELAKPNPNVEVLYDLSVRELNKDIFFRAHGPFRMFNRRAGLRYTFDDITSSAHAASLLQTGMHAIIRNWRARGVSGEQLRIAMQELKNPEAIKSPMAMELEKIMNQLFDPNKNNFLSRNSVGPAHFNKILESVDFDSKFRVPLDATPEVMNNIWREWDITHVEDFISKLTGAMTKTAEDISIGAAITSHWGSKVPQKGYVKLSDKAGKNPLFPLIDQSLYYPQYIADEFVHVGKFMTEARSFKPGTGLHTFVTKIMDPIINSLKMTQTTLKPGHHIMSIIGDMWRNNLALTEMGITNPVTQLKLYYQSARILKANLGTINELSAFEKFQRLQGITTDIKIHNDGTGAEFFGNIGKGGNITRTKLYELMQAKGVALPAHLGGMVEDFTTQFDELDSLGKKTGNMAIDTVGKVTSGLDRMANPLSGKYSLNAFTANRDTWTRGVLFLGAMRSKKFRTVEEASEYAAQQVKKWAPTALDMGAAESKWARRAIFYYTWMRGMVPRIIESALMNPGVATIPNKLMYNVAISNGIDPTSIGDPFPEDTLLPDWYTERVIGPQYSIDGDLWGANPTGPLGDIMNSLGSNVKPEDFLGPEAFTKTAGTFLNMSNPMFRAPWETITGRTIERGIPVTDRAQYFQDMVGPARVASKALGKELYPVLSEDGIVFPNRTEKKFARGMTGEETVQNALPELLNWASGMNFTNFTSDAATNTAYYQRREERKKERKWQQRLGQ